MKKIKFLMIAFLSLSFGFKPAQAAETQTAVTDAKVYLQQQLAELADLKEQITVINQKKRVTKVVLAVSATAAVGGLIVAKVAHEGRALINEVQTDLHIPLTKATGIDVLTIGTTVAVGGAAITAVSGGYLIYLNAVELRNLELQIDEIQSDINQTLAQIVLSK